MDRFAVFRCFPCQIHRSRSSPSLHFSSRCHRVRTWAGQVVLLRLVLVVPPSSHSCLHVCLDARSARPDGWRRRSVMCRLRFCHPVGISSRMPIRPPPPGWWKGRISIDTPPFRHGFPSFLLVPSIPCGNERWEPIGHVATEDANGGSGNQTWTNPWVGSHFTPGSYPMETASNPIGKKRSSAFAPTLEREWGTRWNLHQSKRRVERNIPNRFCDGG